MQCKIRQNFLRIAAPSTCFEDKISHPLTEKCEFKCLCNMAKSARVVLLAYCWLASTVILASLSDRLLRDNTLLVAKIVGYAS